MENKMAHQHNKFEAEADSTRVRYANSHMPKFSFNDLVSAFLAGHRVASPNGVSVKTLLLNIENVGSEFTPEFGPQIKDEICAILREISEKGGAVEYDEESESVLSTC
jgi:hypothetical protein